MNTDNTALSWSVAGTPGGTSATGTISPTGIFTAPQTLPADPAVTVTAASMADPTKSASATVTIASDIAVNVFPATAAVELGGQQSFQASVVSAGKPSTAVAWSLSGPGCTGAACGTVDASGIFTAPQIMPSPGVISLTAKSVADPSRSASATITPGSHFTFTVTGPSSVAAASSADFAATLTPAPNSNPATAVSWSVAGAGCSGAACGTIAAGGSGATAVFTAPLSAPSPNQVTLTATPVADPAKAVALPITITAGVVVSLTLAPTAASLAVNHRQTFTAQLQNAANPGLTWQVNGVTGGNSAVGQICVVNSNPCAAPASGAASVDYVAPAAVPSPNPVTLTVVSVADPTKSAGSAITILPHIVVAVSPPSVTLAPGATQAFTASVAGTADQQVTWSLAGSGCASLSGAAPCGVVDASGFYSAPSAAPSPNSLTVTATSSEDTSRSGSAAVTFTAQPAIISLAPSSAVAGSAGGFTLLVNGGNFSPSTTGTGSAIRVNGVARATLCDTAASCSTSLAASDLAIVENLSVTVGNPDGAVSNAAIFSVIPPASTPENIALTTAAPSAGGKDISVADLTTNGSSAPLQDASLSVAAIGPFSAAAASCTLGAGPVTLAPPASGFSTAGVCLFSVSGLDPSMSFTVTGPVPTDVAIVAKQPLGLGIVGLTIETPSTAATGARTLFVQNAELDVSAATGALDVQ